MQRRILEIWLAIDLANEFAPHEIMSIYAQRIAIGARCFGFDSALEYRLGTTPDEATLAEVLTLAAVIRAPYVLDRDPERLGIRYNALAVTGNLQGFWDDETTRSLIEAGPAQLSENNRCPTSG